MSRAKITGLLAAALLVLNSGLALAGPDGANRIRGISVKEEPDETVITIAADRTPTFSVFKLDDPVRLFVDVSQGDTSAVSEPVVVDNGVLDRVAAMQFRSNGAPVGRIVIGLRDSAAYDVKTVDRGIVVRIDGSGRRPTGENQAALAAQVSSVKAELAREKELLEKIREARERDSRLRLSEEQSRLEAERLRAKAEELKKNAEGEAVGAARLAAEEKARLEDVRKARIAEEKSRNDLNGLIALENSKLEEVRRAREREEGLNRQLAAARTKQEEAKIAAIQSEIEAARTAKAGQEKEIEALRAQVEAARAESIKTAELARQAERLQTRVAAEKAELDKVTREHQEASKAYSETVRRLEDEEKRLAVIAATRTRAEQEAIALRAEVESLKNARKAVETDEARKLREQIEARETELKALRARADEAGVAAQSVGIRLAAKEREVGELKSTMEGERRSLENRLESERKAASAEISAREKEIVQLKADAEKARKAAAVADGRMTEAQKAALDKLAVRERELAAARAEIEKAQQDAAARIEQERSESAARLAAREKEVEGLRAALVQAGRAAESTAKNEALARQEREVAELRTRYEASLADVRETNRRQEETIRDLAGRVETARGEVDSARKEILSKEREISELKASLEASRKAGGADSAKAAELSRVLASKEASLAETEESLKRHLSEVEDLANRRAGQVARLQEEVRRLQDESTKAADSRVSGLQAQLANREAEITVLKKAWEESRSKAGRDNDERTARLQKMIEEQQAATASIKARYEQELASTSDAVRERESRIAELSAQLKALKDNSSERETREVERLRSLVAARETELQKARLAADSATKAGQASDARLGGELSKRNAEIEKARAALESARAEMTAAKEREAAAIQKEQAAAATIERLSAAVSEAGSRLAGKQAEVDRLNAELARARESEQSAVTAATAEQEAKIARLESELARAVEAERTAGRSARAELGAEIEKLSRALAEAKEAETRAARSVNEATRAEIDRLNAELVRARAAAEKPAPVQSAAVRSIDFKTTSDGPSVVLSVEGEADYSVTAKDGSYVLTIDGAKLPAELARRLDVTAFGTPVKMISSYPGTNGRVQIVADLDKPIGQNIARQGGKLVWTFSGPSAGEMMAGAVPTPRMGRVVAQNATNVGAPPPAPAPAPLTPEMKSEQSGEGQGYLRPSMVPKKKKYQGRKINLTVKDADIQNVLTFLAREGKVNIVTSEDVKGKVTFHLEDVPWDLALDTVLKAKGLDYVVEQGIYRVASAESIQKEYETKVEKAKKQRELKPVIVRLIPVNYGKGEEMATRLKDVLSDKGTVSVDERTNTLVVKDTEDYLVAAEELVKKLDQQTPQILIEARIVEARTTFSEDIGIQWGGNFAMSSAYGNETGVVFPSSIGLAGGTGSSDPKGGISLDNPNWAVNLPAAVGTGSGGAIGIQLGSIGGIGNLTLRLSAAEENGDVKIISSPRISTLDNRKASISQGVQIPISVVSAAGVNTQFFSAELKLDVQPHVTRDGHINLKLDITKNEPDFGNLAANGNPTIQNKEAHTELLIRDGDTTVIGGIYTRSTGKSFKKIPFLGDIPVLGWLFKSRNKTDNRSELLIFITPKVVNREVSL